MTDSEVLPPALARILAITHGRLARLRSHLLDMHHAQTRDVSPVIQHRCPEVFIFAGITPPCALGLGSALYVYLTWLLDNKHSKSGTNVEMIMQTASDRHYPSTLL